MMERFTCKKADELIQSAQDAVDAETYTAIDDDSASTLTKLQEQIDIWLDRVEAKLDELGFYQDCLDKLGGAAFSRENVKPGYLVKIRRYGVVEVLSTGPKNFKAKDYGWPMQYAEIIEIVKAQEPKTQAHPFRVGDTFTCHRWNRSIPPHGDTEKVTYTIINATEKSVTLKTGDEKPIVRKPVKRDWRDDWQVSVTDWTDGTWYKAVAETK